MIEEGDFFRLHFGSIFSSVVYKLLKIHEYNEATGEIVISFSLAREGRDDYLYEKHHYRINNLFKIEQFKHKRKSHSLTKIFI